MRDPDGGTAYVLYREDRVGCAMGARFLGRHKIRESSATNRVVATCCNSAMFMDFDDGKHWVSVYRSRFREDAPPLEMRICTKFGPGSDYAPGDVRAYSGFPLRFLTKLVVARISMLAQR